MRFADRGKPCPYGTILISHSQTTAFSLFLVICLTLFGVIFLPVAKVILRLSRSDILFASSTAVRQYHSAESRISLRSNRTRRKANRTEKSTCNSKCFFLVRETGLEPVRDYHTPLKRARLPIPPLSHIQFAVPNDE